MHPDYRRPLITLCCLCLLSLAGSTARAEENPYATASDPPAYQMEKVVVTADEENGAHEGPASITVITREQIEALPALDVDDVLKHAAGVQLWQPWGPFGPASKQTLRGFSQSRATVLMKDGMPVDRVLCGSAKTNEFPLEMVEEIMIARGMNASVMGQSAMGGIIHIESKTPGDKTEAHLKGRYGTFNTWSTDAFLSTRLTPQWGILGGYHHFDTDGYHSWSGDWIDAKLTEWAQYDQKGQDTSDHFLAAVADKQTRTTDSASGRLVFSPGGTAGDTHLSLDGSYWDNAVHNSMAFNDNYQERRRLAFDVKHTGGIDLNLGLAYLREYFSFVRPHTPTPTAFTQADARYYYTVEGQESEIPLLDYTGAAGLGFSLGDHQRFLLAGRMRYGTLENEIRTLNTATGELEKSDLMEGKQVSASISLNDEIAWDRLTLSLGAQYERVRYYDSFYEDAAILEAYDDRDEEAVNPRLGLHYRLTPATTLRGSVARSSNFPSLISLFGIFEQPPGRERIGNPNLKTEYAVGYEAGVDHRAGDKLALGLTGFYNDLYDWMESTEARADLPDQDLKETAVLWQNVDRATTAGAEVTARWTPRRDLGLFANYTYTYTRIDRFEEAEVRYKYFTRTTTHNKEKEGNWLSGQPRHSANAGVVWRPARIADISLTVRYVGERYHDVENTLLLDPYTTVDLKISRGFGRHLKAALTVNNLFDETWQDDDRHQSPGRMIFAGVKVGI
jgi:outer membrane receptor protein involved in Fe transport